MNYFLKRALLLPPLLLLISFIAFLLVHAAPGGPFDRERKPASPEIERALLAKYHLDEPILKQYVRYLGLWWERDAQGHWHHAPPGFNVSLRYRNHSVLDILRASFPVSMSLGLLAAGFALGLGIPVGCWSAVRRGARGEAAVSILTLITICVPGLVLGPLLIMFFAIHWRWFPVGLWGSWPQAVLPMIALGLYFAGRIARLMREGMLGTLRQDFIITARAKGVGESAILLRHALRLAIMPVVSYCGPMFADLLTGSFVVESIFQVPGMGLQIVNSSLNSDYPMTVALALVYAAVLVTLNLAVDAAYAALDPRIQYNS